ncbi:MAG: DUF1512 domain-containing protein [Thaumarchaeota archaeon]|nr:DUF1512 domain-containing protein [Nitrososphaerota archaeon]
MRDLVLGFAPLQLVPQDSLLSNPILSLLLFYVPFFIFLLYGQRFQTMLILNEISRSVKKLQGMKERSRKEAIDYLTTTVGQSPEITNRVDQFLEYFTIMPVDIDPSGVMQKLEHIVTLRDERVRAEVKKIAPAVDPVRTSTIENMIEVATSLNYIYKIVRHFYLLGDRTKSIYVLVQLQMIMPLILQEADALIGAIDAFKQVQPIGDGIGPMIIGKMMLGKEKKNVARDTVYSEGIMNGRTLYLLKAEGPGGNVGQPGTAIQKMIEETKIELNTIVMIDAALKLEGEKTGDIAEGIGAAIGGIGVDRFKIEAVATKHNIPLYAIVIKQSIVDAISVMKKEIADSAEKVHALLNRIIEEKTKEGDKVLIVGVGNSLGVGQ